MMAQPGIDILHPARLAAASIFANMVVVAILAGMVVMVGGLVLLCLGQKAAMKYLVYGAVLAGAFIALAVLQFGAVPVTFDGVAKLGLATFPAGPVLATYQAVTTWLLDKTGWAANAMIGIGAVWFLVNRGGSGAPVKLVLLGVVVAGIGSLIGTGGMITWIMAFAGIHAPVV